MIFNLYDLRKYFPFKLKIFRRLTKCTRDSPRPTHFSAKRYSGIFLFICTNWPEIHGRIEITLDQRDIRMINFRGSLFLFRPPVCAKLMRQVIWAKATKHMDFQKYSPLLEHKFSAVKCPRSLEI